MRFGSFALVAVAAALTATAGTARAGAPDATACYLQVAARDLANRRIYQTALRDLIADQAPTFADLAELNWRLQIARAEARHRQLDYLLKTAPERVATDASLAAFTNFDWSAADDRDLSRREPAFAVLRGEIESLSRRSDGDPEWPALRGFLRDDLARRDAFKKITAAFMTARTETEIQLALCNCR